MPFEKGRVANPLGRNSEKLQYKRLAADLMGPHFETAVQEVLNQLTNAAENGDRQWAAEMVFNYVVGKPAQALELTGADGESLFTMSITPLTADKFAAEFAPKLISDTIDVTVLEPEHE
jgi:hypothetical protein